MKTVAMTTVTTLAIFSSVMTPLAVFTRCGTVPKRQAITHN